MELQPMSWDMKVRSVTKINREKENGTITMHKLMARDKEGVNEITISSGNPFPGLSAKDGVIQVKITSSQASLSDFQVTKPGRPKKK